MEVISIFSDSFIPRNRSRFPRSSSAVCAWMSSANTLASSSPAITSETSRLVTPRIPAPGSFSRCSTFLDTTRSVSASLPVTTSSSAVSTGSLSATPSSGSVASAGSISQNVRLNGAVEATYVRTSPLGSLRFPSENTSTTVPSRITIPIWNGKSVSDLCQNRSPPSGSPSHRIASSCLPAFIRPLCHSPTRYYPNPPP